MENLLKISLAGSIVGIFLLLLLADFLPLPLTNLEDIDNSMINQKVKIQGEIFKIENKENFQILSIRDETGRIDILSNSNITSLQEIEVKGTVKEYNGYLQIQANKIIKK
jgi:RecJ-like exonuclease